MAKKSDLGSKRLIGLAPNNWAKWVTQQPELEFRAILSGEFQWIERASDVILQVFSPQHGEFLILNELQLRYKGNLPQRMRSYAALAEEKFYLPIYPVLVNILPPKTSLTIPDRYQSEFLGIHAYQGYRVINLWEVEANLVFEQNLSSLLPFVPILRGGGEPSTVRQALRELRANESLQDLEPLLSFFASFVLEIPLVREIMRWDMTVLRESPWYNTILEEGWQEGFQSGRQEGRQEEAVSLVLRQLSRRCGTLPEEASARVASLPVTLLEALSEDLLDFTSLADLNSWLETHS